MNVDALRSLVVELTNLPRETEWLEFKLNNQDPREIGELISGLANSAALLGRDRGYLVWGVQDGGRGLIGTTFRPREARVGGHELEHWLVTQLHPRLDFRFHELTVDGRFVVVLEVPAASHSPVRFQDFDHIRVGSYTNKLRDHPEKERELWTRLGRASFEFGIARARVSVREVTSLLDVDAYFRSTQQPGPTSDRGAVERLVADRLVIARSGDQVDVTNLAAMLFARRLSDFGSSGRKALRVVTYDGDHRTRAVRERVDDRGYACGFADVLAYIDTQLPSLERVENGLRTLTRSYPEDTVRETLGNALIHQDFSVTGAGPMVEIFSERIEITNPGAPLVPVDRLLDAPPVSRNEALAAMMRRMRMCEERGSGVDRVVQAVEASLLPAPDFVVVNGHTRVTILGPRAFARMTREDRLRGCYQHACLQWVAGQRATNATLRSRFGIADQNYSIASRLLAEAVEAGFIKPFDPTSGSKRHAQYVPYWA